MDSVRNLEALREHKLLQLKQTVSALESISFDGIQAIDTIEGNTIVGKILGIKDNQLLIQVIAAKEVDYKLRNLESKGFKKRTYPLPLYLVVGSKTVQIEEVPLYINFKFKSTQFKNRYFKAPHL